MGWIKAAEGTSFYNLSEIMGDMSLPAGTKMKVIMDVDGFDWLFDSAGAELAFKPFMPSGMKLLDVYGQNGQGIVDMEVTDTRYSGIAALPALPWTAIVIGTIALITLVSLIVIMIKVPAVAAIPGTLIVGVALGVIGLIVLGNKLSPRVPAR